ncbi:MAG: sensor histidine kinase [Lachnospiraceae bacterium]|nr:sensor histidine kinase [Lachnospiraceae bacterium]
MTYFIDQIILWCIGGVFFLYGNISAKTLIIFLAMLSLACFENSFKGKYMEIVITLAFIVVCLFTGKAICLLPAVCYIFLYRKRYMYMPIYALLLIAFGFTNTKTAIVVVLGLALSAYLAYQSYRISSAGLQIKELRDDAVEKELALKKSATELRKNHDHELYIATLSERNRIAREIHDNVGHMLSRSILQLGALLAICKDEFIKGHLNQLKGSLDEAMNSIRSSVHDLHEVYVDIKLTMEKLADEFEFCEISMNCDEMKQVDKDIKYAFIAITREGLNNIIKHSNATRVNVRCKELPAFYQLVIEDNGTGADYSKKSEGIGLINMRERIEALGGVISFDASKGFKIHISVPKR